MLDRYTTSIGLFFLLLCCPAFLLAQIPNSSFENWEIASNGYNEPLGWEVNNFEQYGEDFISVYQDSLAIHGKSSIALFANAKTFEGYCPGAATLILPENVFLNIPSALKAWIRCSIPDVNNKGACIIYIRYFKDREVIRGSEWVSIDATNGFVPIELPMERISFDSMGIYIRGGSIVGPLGCVGEATMWVDSLAFDYSTTPTQNIHKSESISIFPNPAKENIHIEKTDKAIQSYRFFDLLGRPLQSKQLDGPSTNFSIPINHLPQGIYFLELLNVDKERIIRKITKQ